VIQFSSESNPFFYNLVLLANEELFVLSTRNEARIYDGLSRSSLEVSVFSSEENTILALENTMSAMAEIRVIGNSLSTRLSYPNWLHATCLIGKSLLLQITRLQDVNYSETAHDTSIPACYKALDSSRKKEARECIAKGYLPTNPKSHVDVWLIRVCCFALVFACSVPISFSSEV
jgi:hypothetical protein